MNIEPGSEIAGRYRVLSSIGRGGAATILKAEDRRLRRIVAIKVIDLPVDDESMQRFQREVEVLGRLNHPGIIRWYDTGLYQNMPYMVVEYAERTLEDVLHNGPQLLESAVAVISQVGEALSYAHEKGVIHADVKPSNILIAADGRLLLSDFGVAMRLGSTSLTATGIVVATPVYASPEQIKGAALDARSDIYSLGVVLFELLAGRPPFSGSGAWEIIAHHVETPVPLDLLPSTVPVSVHDVILKALSKVPEDRYNTVGEFTSALRAASAVSLSTSDTASNSELIQYAGFVDLAAMAQRRSAKRWVVAGLLLIGVLIVVSGFFILGSPRSPLWSAGLVQPRDWMLWIGVILLTLVIGSAVWFGRVKMRGKKAPSLVSATGQLQPYSARPHITQPFKIWPTGRFRTEILVTEEPLLAWLVLKNGPTAGATHRLGRQRSLIGRDPASCDIVIDDPTVSKQHAAIILEGNRFIVVDLGSFNGVVVNEERVQRIDLRDGDEIKMGTAVLVYKRVNAPDDATGDARRRLREFEDIWTEITRSVNHD